MTGGDLDRPVHPSPAHLYVDNACSNKSVLVYKYIFFCYYPEIHCRVFGYLRDPHLSETTRGPVRSLPTHSPRLLGWESRRGPAMVRIRVKSLGAPDVPLDLPGPDPLTVDAVIDLVSTALTLPRDQRTHIVHRGQVLRPSGSASGSTSSTTTLAPTFTEDDVLVVFRHRAPFPDPSTPDPARSGSHPPSTSTNHHLVPLGPVDAWLDTRLRRVGCPDDVRGVLMYPRARGYVAIAVWFGVARLVGCWGGERALHLYV